VSIRSGGKGGEGTMKKLEGEGVDGGVVEPLQWEGMAWNEFSARRDRQLLTTIEREGDTLLSSIENLQCKTSQARKVC